MCRATKEQQPSPGEGLGRRHLLPQPLALLDQLRILLCCLTILCEHEHSGQSTPAQQPHAALLTSIHANRGITWNARKACLLAQSWVSAKATRPGKGNQRKQKEFFRPEATQSRHTEQSESSPETKISAMWQDKQKQLARETATLQTHMPLSCAPLHPQAGAQGRAARSQVEMRKLGYVLPRHLFPHYPAELPIPASGGPVGV